MNYRSPIDATGTTNGIILDNGGSRVTLSRQTGAILQIENRIRDLRLVSHPAANVPWRIEVLGEDGSSRWIESFTSFDFQSNDAENSVHLRWETQPGLVVEANVLAPRAASSVAFEITVRGHPDIIIDKIEYPIVTGIGDLHETADSILAHSQGTGFLFRRPLHLFETEPIRRQGLRYSPYPEAFNGSTMQFMSYYAEGVGGFLMETPDASGAMKWFNFYKGASGSLECTFLHQSSDMQPGLGLDVSYPVLFEPMNEGNWYEAAEHYKRWAGAQPWTAQGTLAERNKQPTWLLDKVGFATFGINAAYDRSKWLDRFHHITDQPVFHVLGVNWPKEPTGYGRGHPGGRDDWFPATFAEENLSVIRENGDYWAPFEFDLLLDEGKADSDLVLANRLQLPEEKYSFDSYRFPFQCPATEYLPALHRWRDATLAGEYGADALYYDISANNVLMTCRNPDHGHPIGGGGWMIDAYASMWSDTGKAAKKAKGARVPQGTEMISEMFIPYLDYYQARAEASPLSAFEADFFRDWIRAGQAEKIPLFTYVYHEYGPVRMDGWGKLSYEIGELFYWVAGRVALWGGLFELNYEFSDLEAFQGLDDDPDQHYAKIARRAYEVDPAKVAFVREIANARTGFARPWLVYGAMIRPLGMTVPDVDLGYHLYNLSDHLAHYDQEGSMNVSSVLHSAWRAPDGRLGFAFVNLLSGTPQTLALTFDPERYGLQQDAKIHISQQTSDAYEHLWGGTGSATVHVPLEPRKVTLVEVRLNGMNAG